MPIESLRKGGFTKIAQQKKKKQRPQREWNRFRSTIKGAYSARYCSITCV